MKIPDLFPITYIRFAAISVVLCGMMSGCSIKDSDDDCPPDVEVPEETARELLYLTVTDDEISRADITATAQFDDLTVYLFDGMGMLADSIPISSQDLNSRKPIDLTGKGMSGGYASVWADIRGSMDCTPAISGKSIDDTSVGISLSSEIPDFYDCPGDIFFGYTRIAFEPVSPGINADTVNLSRKNGRLNITVKGLPQAEDDDYYFLLNTKYTEYSYRGIPIIDARNIREIGEFNDEGDFISPQPYVLVHNPIQGQSASGDAIVVNLFKTGAEGQATDFLMASTDRDVNGRAIIIEPNKTTNVLIVFSGIGDIEIMVVITEWDEIHQWSIW